MIFISTGFTVVQKVLNASHKLDNATLTVEKFYPFLQKPTVERKNSAAGIAVAVDAHILEFISSTHHLKELTDALMVHAFTVHCDPVNSIVYISPEQDKEASADNRKGIAAVNEFARKFQQFELNVESKHWEAVIAEIATFHHDIGGNEFLLLESHHRRAKLQSFVVLLILLT